MQWVLGYNCRVTQAARLGTEYHIAGYMNFFKESIIIQLSKVTVSVAC